MIIKAKLLNNWFKIIVLSNQANFTNNHKKFIHNSRYKLLKTHNKNQRKDHTYIIAKHEINYNRKSNMREVTLII